MPSTPTPRSGRATTAPKSAPSKRPPPDAICADVSSVGVFLTCIGKSWAGVISDASHSSDVDVPPNTPFFLYIFERNKRILYIIISLCLLIVVLVLLGMAFSSSKHHAPAGHAPTGSIDAMGSTHAPMMQAAPMMHPMQMAPMMQPMQMAPMMQPMQSAQMMQPMQTT